MIREDVVSIGFEVEQNPFGELMAGINDIKAKLGILNETSDDLKDVGQEANLAAKDVSNLADSLRAPPAGELAKPVEAVETAAKGAQSEVGGLSNEMDYVGKTDMSSGVQELGNKTKTPRKGLKELLGQAKKIAKEKLDTGIKQLPPHLQIGIKVGAGLGKVLGKAAKISFKSVASGVKSLASHAASAAKSLGQMAVKGSIKGIAIGLTAATAAMGAGAVAAYNLGAAYETSLAKVSTMVDTSLITMDELSGQVIGLSNATGEGAAELNEAVYQALSAGAKSDQVVDLVSTAVKAAKGGFTDTTTAVDGLTSTLNAYGMATGEAEGLANQFLITQNKGKTTFGELASSIGGVAPTAKAAGVGVDQLLAGVASLTANGVGTSEAMTGIKAALSNVIKPSSEAEKMAKSLGLEFNTAALQSKGLVGFLDDVKKATGGDTDKMAKLFGSVEALNTVLTLTSDQGSQLMNDTLNEMATNTGALDAAYETMADTTQESVKRGLNTFKNLGIGIFQSSEGIVSDLTGLFAQSGQELYEAFQNGGMDGLSDQVGTTLTNVLVTLTGYLPRLVQSGVSIVQSLISGVIRNRAQISQSVITGVTTLLTGLVQMVPQLISAGIMLLGSLLQGLNQQMPGILSVGLAAIQNLCAGLIANAPSIIQSGISLIMQLINGLIAAAPTILITGIQLVIQLVQGLIRAIPQLVQAIPQLISAIITTLMSVNWIKLGLDIIKGIGSGLVEGIKGLFSKGEDAGKEVGDGLTAGLNESTSDIVAAGDETATAATESMAPDSVDLADYGVQAGDSLAAGITAGTPAVAGAAGTVSDDFLNSLNGLQDTSGIGANAVSNLADGMAANAATVQVPMDLAGAEEWNTAMQSLVEQTEQSINTIPDIFEESLTATNDTIAGNLTTMQAKFSGALVAMEARSRIFGATLKGIFEGIRLYNTGVNIMTGLNNGMQSMKGSLLATARGIASGISGSMNQTLDIHSPSRVTEQTGEYTDLGLIKGMQNLHGKVAGAARSVGDTTARHMVPFKSRYTPDSSMVTNSQTSSEVNTYSPVFNLTLNGASATDSNERKVKRWVREAMKEAMEGMGRTNPRLREV